MSWILGLWDGHDSGCALLQGDRIVVALNEERLSRRKLEVGFPGRSIEAALRSAGISPAEVGTVAYTTSDFAKTLSRWAPSLQESYYQLRRRKADPGPLNAFKKRLKYRITEWKPSPFSRALSRIAIRKSLANVGIRPEKLLEVGHHDSHAAAALYCSGFEDCLVLTVDGIGDGLSGGIWSYQGRELSRVGTISGRTSFGIFFEHVTNLMNMRELEDEGKVMALAGYTVPVPDEENPMLKLFTVEGVDVRSRYSSGELHSELSKILWRSAPEQFAYMAQRALEIWVVAWARNALRRTGHRRLAFAGGVASNVKLNMLIRELPEVGELFVFPHMGDGGQAIGAAMWANRELHGISSYRLGDAYLGLSFGEKELLAAVHEHPGARFERRADIAADAARLIAGGEVISWFEGRMEYGPRALGARSILARPDSAAIKDALNLRLKKRSWFQPFCPVMLSQDALDVLVGVTEPYNAFMTCAYRTRPEHKAAIEGVIAPDGTCRPQIIDERTAPDTRYVRLLQEIRKSTGRGILLNTSFNLHGEPLVCSPSDAMRTFMRSDMKYLVFDDFLVTKS